MFVETLLRRVVDLAEEYPRGEVPDRVLWEKQGDDYEEYIEAAKRLEGEGLVESSTSDYATLRPRRRERKHSRAFENSQTHSNLANLCISIQPRYIICYLPCPAGRATTHCSTVSSFEILSALLLRTSYRVVMPQS